MDSSRQDQMLRKIGKRLKKTREEKGLSLRELADKAEVAYNTIHRVEQGLADPRATTILYLAEALGVDPAIFFK